MQGAAAATKAATDRADSKKGVQVGYGLILRLDLRVRFNCVPQLDADASQRAALLEDRRWNNDRGNPKHRGLVLSQRRSDQA